MNEVPLRVLIVDDEPLARDSIRLVLEGDDELHIVGECGGGAEALDALTRGGIDIVFLDVHMPEMDGFAVLRGLALEAVPIVVFVTAYDEFAVKAFETQALDYVVKPFEDSRLLQALQRAKSMCRQRRALELASRVASLLGDSAVSSPTGGSQSDRAEPESDEDGHDIIIRHAGRVVRVEQSEIDWIEAADYCVRLHVGKEEWLYRESLDRLEKRLPQEDFVRVHRSALVRLARIREIRKRPSGDARVVLKDGTEVRLSRSRRKRIESLLG